MRTGHANFLRDLLRLTGPPAGADPTDGDLLDRFTAGRDESAFHELMRRHAPLVLGVCRRVVRGEQDVEDAFQATFLVLVQKARSIRRRASLASWLHGVAFRCAARLRAANLRRCRHEARASPPPAAAPPDLTWREVQQAIDEELARLPEKYRAPLVLCYLRGKTQCEAARELGWGATVLRGRLDRGRERLRARLARRGLTLSAGLLAAALAGEASAAGVPAALVSSTLKAALLVAAGRAVADVTSGPVAALAKGALRTMLWTKVKIMTACALLALGIIGIGGALGRQTAAGGPADDPPANKADAKPDPQRQAEAPPRADKPAEQPPRDKEKDKGKPAPAPKPGEKQYYFAMDNKPWGEVLQWLSEQTGLACVSASKPTGAFTFVPPRVNGSLKEYTIPEILDILNEALQANGTAQKFVLLRRDRTILLLPAEEKIDPTLVPRVDVSQLAKRGKRELVKVVVSLNVLPAADLALDVKKMLGPFGDVIALDLAGQLIVQDTAGNLLEVVEMIQEAERRALDQQRQQKGK
jgi:RNA polymerase sigma factor (sigma-70 family)